jgi:hypothetical protein
VHPAAASTTIRSERVRGNGGEVQLRTPASCFLWFFAIFVMVGCPACRRDPSDEPPAPLPPPPAVTPVPTASASVEAKDAAPASEPMDAELAGILGADAGSPRALALLKSLGFAGKELEGTGRTVRVASRSMHPLDADPELESVVQISATSSAGTTTQMLELYVAWLDPRAGKGLEVVGHRRLVLKTCTYEPTYTLSTQPTHTSEFDDTVIEWEAITACDGHLGTTGTIVTTLERGKAEVILELEDTFEFGQGSGKVFDAKGFVRFEGKTASLVEDGKVKKELVFDPTTFRYR